MTLSLNFFSPCPSVFNNNKTQICSILIIRQEHYVIITAGIRFFGRVCESSAVKATGKERYNQDTDKSRGVMIGMREMK